MATEYKLSYTASEINNKIGKIDDLVEAEERLTNEIAVERTRINTFTALEDGSTTGDAELQDVRVGYNGVAYETAGEAVRGQVNNLYSKLSQLDGTYLCQEITFEEGKYANTIGNVIQNHSYFALTNPIHVMPKTKVKVTSYITANNVGVALLNGETIVSVVSLTDQSSTGVYTKEIDIPSVCDNIRISVVSSHKAEVAVSFNNIVKNMVDAATDDIIIQTERRLDKAEDWQNMSLQNATASFFKVRQE